MIDPSNVPAVDADESLARYVLYSRQIRKSDETIRPEAFIPHPYQELSVTRHREATEEELWQVGAAVAAVRNRNLYGRGDVAAGAFVGQGLEVEAAPIANDPHLPDNPNHANVTGWPASDYHRQRLIAIEIARLAALVRAP
jgi:hypothetical protein